MTAPQPPAGGRDVLDTRIRFAIRTRRLISVRYDGAERVAEPHDYGVQKGRQRLLTYQLRAPSRPGRLSTGWRLLDVSKIEALQVRDETFAGSRGQSHPHHQEWEVLFARVD